MNESREVSQEALVAGLTSMLNGEDGRPRFGSLVSRERCAYSSTFPTEVVTCQLDNGAELRLFCKYSGTQKPEDYSAEWFDHYGGVRYEAQVYGEVLQPLRLSACGFYGAHQDSETGQDWFAMDYLEGWQRIDWHWQAGSLAEAAKWIGRFHLANESRAGNRAFLRRYTPAYYRGWVARTAEYARFAPGEYLWVNELCARFPEAMHLLLLADQTVIHGEYS